VIGRIPRPVRYAGGFAVLFAVAFTATVLPLFITGGAPKAEIAGSVPGDAVAGQQMFLDLAVDNTGTSIIHPVCIGVTSDRPVIVQKAVFQGLDTVAFSDGRVCGGELTGQETASVRIVIVPQSTGTLHLDLTPSQGSRTIGPVVHRTVQVAAR
jgi:hypothetical protein